jgi:cytochrome c peroxidase
MSSKRILLGLIIVSWGSLAVAAGIPKEKVTRPAGTLSYQGDRAELVQYGEQLWNDKKLSRSGKTSCARCHKGNTRKFNKSFLEPYPHPVKMPNKKSGLTSINAEQMVQFMMVSVMRNDVLPWKSKELAALTAYVIEVVQKQYLESKKR